MVYHWILLLFLFYNSGKLRLRAVNSTILIFIALWPIHPISSIWAPHRLTVITLHLAPVVLASRAVHTEEGLGFMPWDLFTKENI